MASAFKPKTGTNATVPEAKHQYAVKQIKIMAGAVPGRWWWVWIKGRPNPHNLGKCPLYFLGKVSGDEEDAARKARAYWPQWRGQMELEECPPWTTGPEMRGHKLEPVSLQKNRRR